MRWGVSGGFGDEVGGWQTGRHRMAPGCCGRAARPAPGSQGTAPAQHLGHTHDADVAALAEHGAVPPRPRRVAGVKGVAAQGHQVWHRGRVGDAQDVARLVPGHHGHHAGQQPDHLLPGHGGRACVRGARCTVQSLRASCTRMHARMPGPIPQTTRGCLHLPPPLSWISPFPRKKTSTTLPRQPGTPVLAHGAADGKAVKGQR